MSSQLCFHELSALSRQKMRFISSSRRDVAVLSKAVLIRESMRILIDEEERREEEERLAKEKEEEEWLSGTMSGLAREEDEAEYDLAGGTFKDVEHNEYAKKEDEDEESITFIRSASASPSFTFTSYISAIPWWRQLEDDEDVDHSQEDNVVEPVPHIDPGCDSDEEDEELVTPPTILFDDFEVAGGEEGEFGEIEEGEEWFGKDD